MENNFYFQIRARGERRGKTCFILTLTFCGLLVVGAQPVAAAVKTWVHGAANNIFSANNNWAPPGSPAQAAPGDDLVFGSDNSVKPNMNDAGGTSTNYSSVTFTNGGFTIRTATDGRLMRIRADGGITNRAGFTSDDNVIGPHVVMLGNLTVANDNTNSKIVFLPDDRNADKYTIDGGNHAITFDGAGDIVIGGVAPNIGEIRNIGSLIKKGSGALELWGTNTWSGNCDVQAGTLRLSTVNQLQGSISIGNGATFAAAIDYPQTSLAVQSLTLGTSSGDVTTNCFELGALGTPAVEVIAVSNLTVNGTTYVNVSGWGLSPGKCSLIKYQTLNGDAANFILGSLPAGVSGYISNNVANKSIDLIIAGPVVPTQADQFVDSLSVNVHINFSHDPTFAVYAYSNTLAAVETLGLRHIREAGFAPWNNDLGSNGIHLQVAIGGCYSSQIPGVVADLVAAAKQVNPGVVDWIEGVNEPGIFDQFMSAQDVFDLQKALWTAFKNDTNLSHIPILMPPLTKSGGGVGYTNDQEIVAQLVALGIEQYADFANSHPYPDSWQMPEGLGRITESLDLNQAAAPNRPMIATEVQYCTVTNSHGVSEWAAGIYLPRLFLELAERGVQRSCIYELFDLPNEGGNFSFAGLFHSDGTTPGTIKPQGNAVKNMIALLADPGEPFEVAALDFTLSGGPLRSKLFQKRNGEYWLALWRPVNVGYWDGAAFVDDYPPTQDAVLKFAGGFTPSSITTYTDLGNDTVTSATLTPATSVTIPDVGGKVTLIKITGSATNTPEIIIYPPRLNESSKLVLAGTNSSGIAGGSYSVLTSTSLAMPLSSWTTNVTGVFGIGGSFTNFIELNSSEAQQFFVIKTP